MKKKLLIYVFMTFAMGSLFSSDSSIDVKPSDRATKIRNERKLSKKKQRNREKEDKKKNAEQRPANRKTGTVKETKVAQEKRKHKKHVDSHNKEEKRREEERREEEHREKEEKKRKGKFKTISYKKSARRHRKINADWSGREKFDKELYAVKNKRVSKGKSVKPKRKKPRWKKKTRTSSTRKPKESRYLYQEKSPRPLKQGGSKELIESREAKVKEFESRKDRRDKYRN